MRPDSFLLRTTCNLALIALIIVCASGFHISSYAAGFSSNFDDATQLMRQKRELENLDESDTNLFQSPDVEATGGGEDTGFWDRMVKVALKLFGKFIEWLNS